MKVYLKEYIDFEKAHTIELQNLYDKTQDEELRFHILALRKTLERIFLMGLK